MQHDNEKEIQQDVQNAGDRQCRERHLGIADAAEDRRFKVVEQNDRHAEQVDAQIQERIGKHIVRHIEHAQKRRGDELAEQRDDRAAKRGKDDRRVYRALDGLVVPAANGGCNDNVCAQRDTDEKVDDETDDGAVRAHGRNGYRACIAREVADDGHI